MRILCFAVLLLAGCATRDPDFDHSQAELAAMAQRIKEIHDRQSK